MVQSGMPFLSSQVFLSLAQAPPPQEVLLDLSTLMKVAVTDSL